MERLLRSKLDGGRFERVSSARSKFMAAVKGRGNLTTEVSFRLALVRARLSGWKVQPRGLPGNPDFFFPDSQIAIFVDGCFWHGCPDCGHIPKINRPFWQAKLLRNQERDQEKNRDLRAHGVSVLRFWEHELQQDLSNCVEELKKAIRTQT